MRPVEQMTDEELHAEAATLQAVYETHLASVSEVLARATNGDLVGHLSRYFELRSELLQRGTGTADPAQKAQRRNVTGSPQQSPWRPTAPAGGT